MSKGLEAFKKICKNLNSYEYTEDFKKNKTLIEKELQALEIIKKKKPRLDLLFISFEYEKRSKENDPDFYNKEVFKTKQFEQKEYDLLKEVLFK